jgi:hypothetical protein
MKTLLVVTTKKYAGKGQTCTDCQPNLQAGTMKTNNPQPTDLVTQNSKTTGGKSFRQRICAQTVFAHI